MTEGEKTRLIAWSNELRVVHGRLREALSLTRDALASGKPDQAATRNLLLFCHGFCTALTGHHEGEDRELFPAIAAAHPELRDTLRRLKRDHSMIAHLITGMQSAVASSATPDVLPLHLEGIAAIMENHFRYEERQPLSVLDTLTLDADPIGSWDRSDEVPQGSECAREHFRGARSLLVLFFLAVRAGHVRELDHASILPVRLWFVGCGEAELRRIVDVGLGPPRFPPQ